MTTSRSLLIASSALFAAGLLAGPARAADAPAAPAAWADAISFGAQIEGGVSFNTQGPKTNFGQLFTDHPNQPTLNQLLLTFSRDIPKDASDWDVGFHVTGLYGADARYTHFTGLLNNALPDQRYQLDIIEASASVHAPVLNGLDTKIGLYPTPLGFEYIDPSLNPFYTHSYIFNFGIPLKHAGVLSILHAADFLDIYAGVDTGVNTSFGDGDNNGTVSGVFGFGLTLLGGSLTATALTHIGPEVASWRTDQPGGYGNANHYNRYLNDAYATYKVDDKLTVTTELNYAKEENPLATVYKGGAEAWGIAEYLAYTVSDTVTANARAEVFRDGKGYFVAYFPGNMDFVNFEEGRHNTATAASLPHATYSEITVGVTWKPADLPKPIAGLSIRPELRYDTTLGGERSYGAYNPGKSDPTTNSVTISTDFILAF